MKKLTKISGALLVTLAVGLTSCTNDSVTKAKALSESYEYDGKVIELEGKFDAPSIFRTNGNTANMNFTTYNDYMVVHAGHTNVNSVNVTFGKEGNSVFIDLPEGEKFKKEDVFIYDKNGTKLTLNDKVKIKGLVTYSNKDEGDKEASKKNYSYKITEVEIEKL